MCPLIDWVLFLLGSNRLTSVAWLEVCKLGCELLDGIECIHHLVVVFHASDACMHWINEAVSRPDLYQRRWIEAIIEADLYFSLLEHVGADVPTRIDNFKYCPSNVQTSGLLTYKAGRFLERLVRPVDGTTVTFSKSLGYLEGPECPSLRPELLPVVDLEGCMLS